MEKQLSRVNRRNFIRLSGISSAGLMVGLSVADSMGAGQVVNMSGAIEESFGLTPFVIIEKTGKITIFNTKPEIGQGTFQSIPSLIAEELSLPLDKVTIKQSGGEKVLGPDQFAGGSASIRTSYTKYRTIGAAAREMLVMAASVAEVSKSGDGVKIEKVYTVIDPGTVVNPDTTVAQVQGAAIMAITAATKNGISFENGKTVQSNYHNNPILRMNETPPIEVHILADGGDKIKGVGEPGLPPVAPALCNALFSATGKRIRNLPFNVNKI